MQGNGCRYPTAFPISVVAWILQREAKHNGGALECFVDPCAGWGDRLAGARMVGKDICKFYYGIDPWDISLKCCEAVSSIPTTEETCSTKLVKACAEDHNHEWPDANLVFTSPPYGDIECYDIDGDDNKKQAWKKCSTGKFVSEFLAPFMIKAAKSTQKLNGRVIINIANNPKSKGETADLTTHIINCGIAAGLKHVETFGMALSVRAPKTTHEHGSHVIRGEPFFVFEH